MPHPSTIFLSFPPPESQVVFRLCSRNRTGVDSQCPPVPNCSLIKVHFGAPLFCFFFTSRVYPSRPLSYLSCCCCCISRTLFETLPVVYRECACPREGEWIRRSMREELLLLPRPWMWLTRQLLFSRFSAVQVAAPLLEERKKKRSYWLHRFSIASFDPKKRRSWAKRKAGRRQ